MTRPPQLPFRTSRRSVVRAEALIRCAFTRSAMPTSRRVPFRDAPLHTKFNRAVTNVPNEGLCGAARSRLGSRRATAANRTHVWRFASASSGANGAGFIFRRAVIAQGVTAFRTQHRASP
jgi:hypothetical protein